MLPARKAIKVGVSYYDALLPVRAPGDGLPGVVAGLRLPYRVLVSIGVPAGRIVVAFVSDSARLSRMFAANWAPAGTGAQPDATLCALARPARGYGLDGRWDQARWWSREHKMMVVFGFGSYRLAKVCVRGICSAVSGDDIVFVHGCALSIGAGPARRGVVITGSSGAGKTTLVAGLLRHPDYPVAVLNDDWGAVSLAHGDSVSTGERMLHMKTGSVLALRPGFFTAAPACCTGVICPSRTGPPGCWCGQKASTGLPGTPRRQWCTMSRWWSASPHTGGRPAAQARPSARLKARATRDRPAITRRSSTDH